MSQNRVLQQFCLIFGAAFQIVMIRIKICCHLFYKRPVLGRLKGIGSEIFLISHKVKGKCHQLSVFLLQLPGADRRHQTGIHASRQKGADGDIGYHLPSDGVFHKKGRFLDSLFIRILVVMALQFPVALLPDSFIRTDQKVTGKYFLHSLKHSVSSCSGRADAEDLVQSVSVQNRTKAGKTEETFDL